MLHYLQIAEWGIDMNNKIFVSRHIYQKPSLIRSLIERLMYFRHFRRNRMSIKAAWKFAGMVVR